MEKILKYFNPNGEDNIRKLVLDDSVIDDASGTWYLDKKYKTWAASLNSDNPGFLEKQYQFLWQPEEISLADDNVQFNNIDEKIKYAIENILSFLQYLDSVVPENVVAIKTITGDFEIKQALGIHEFVEGGIHTKSYQYILKSLFGEDTQKIKEVYYRFKTNDALAKRNKIIADNFQPLRNIIYTGILNSEEGKYKEAFFRSIIQDFFIESTVFFMGFMFFHILTTAESLLPGVNQQIILIKRDEELHVSLFKKIIKTFEEEEKMFYNENLIYEIAHQTAEADKEFYLSTIKDSLPGLSEQNITNYIEYLMDRRLNLIGLKPIYNNNQNPFKTIEALNTFSELRKSNFFETGSVEYFSIEDINWEEKVKEELDNLRE